MDKRSPSERDICTKFITPARRMAGWDEMLHIREAVSFTKARSIMRRKLVSRGKAAHAYAAIAAERRAVGCLARLNLTTLRLDGEIRHGGKINSASRLTRII